MASDNPSPLGAQILAKLREHNLVNYHEAVPDALFRAYLGSISSVYSIDNLTELASLNVYNLSLVDMGGIEYATNLTYLKANKNQLPMIIISNLTNLTYLHLADNQLTDIGSVAALVNLTSLYLYNTQLTDIGSVAALVNLTSVWAYNNQLTDIGNVAALVNLTSLYLNSNQLAQSELETIIDELWTNRVALGANSCDIRLQVNPGSTATATSKASEIADLITAGCSVTI